MGKIDIPFWKFVFDLIQTMFTVGIAIYVWIVAKHKANASRINALEDKTTADIHEVTQRLTVIETKVEQMPDRTAIGNIHRRLDEQAPAVATYIAQAPDGLSVREAEDAVTRIGGVPQVKQTPSKYRAWLNPLPNSTAITAAPSSRRWSMTATTASRSTCSTLSSKPPGRLSPVTAWKMR